MVRKIINSILNPINKRLDDIENNQKTIIKLLNQNNAKQEFIAKAMPIQEAKKIKVKKDIPLHKIKTKYKFGKSSLDKLKAADKNLQRIAYEVLKYMDVSVAWAHRTEAEQNELYNRVPKVTNVRYPNSAHNAYPSRAIDLVPCVNGKQNWESAEHAYAMAGYIRRIADTIFADCSEEFEIVIGHDWDGDGDITDQKLHDAYHVEIRYKNR